VIRHERATPLLTAEGLTYRVAGKALVSGVDLQIGAGEFVAVIGRNGAGKSTLLNLVVGELPAAEGRVTLFGQSSGRLAPRDLARRRAVLAQHTPLEFDYRVLEVVLLGRIPHQRHGGETPGDTEIARECLARVDLRGFEERRYLTLSGGEQQRVHLARVLAQIKTVGEAPRLLFLDEPTSSLDIAHQHHLLDVAKALNEEGVGVFAVLHDLNLAAQYADRVLVLAEGRVVASGPPAEVLTEAILWEAFRFPVLVMRHPEVDCPLIVTTGVGSRARGSRE
jgi:ABC-type hemin transport system, ATPase component